MLGDAAGRESGTPPLNGQIHGVEVLKRGPSAGLRCHGKTVPGHSMTLQGCHTGEQSCQAVAPALLRAAAGRMLLFLHDRLPAGARRRLLESCSLERVRQ